MKLHKVKVAYTFTGHYYIVAGSHKEAKEIVNQNAGLTIGAISINDDDIKNWDFDVHPTKTIIK